MREKIASNRGLILLLGMLTAFGSMSIDMYLPAFPAIARDFGVSIADVQLTLAAFNIGIALGQLLYGPLADKLGRKPNLIVGILLYIAASVGCAFADSVNALILLRFLQALGGCAGMVIARAVVRDKFAGNASAGMFSTLMLIMGVAPILAPTVGGLIIQHLHWSYIFWALVAFSSIALLWVLASLPETLPVEARNPLAVRNAFRTYGLLLRDRAFTGYALSAGMVQGGMFAYITGSSFVFIKLFGLSEQQYALLFGLNASGLIAASQLNHLLLRRFTFTQVLRAAVTINVVAALVMLVMASTGWLGVYGIVVPLFFTVGSMGITSPNATAGSLQHHAVRAGSASALLGTLMFTGGALASIAVSVFASASARPMAAVIAVCGILAWTVFHLLVARQPAEQAVEEGVMV
ncbi:Bcr/CflA family multidrug efflux MFS transporter [Hymenobacter aerilatus]|uniref:Bcr/CflA family multidrug efflux MFS transporter n=1 Tax=Hymenobacter aerilatus TaxID=2932251 RepID=A0A8T9T1D4_9BACT|nr:Bcr/CflA family multidrug efflux MFS transporter [Hymenobacter aerilatus]UOR06783.1 Bcr/CflA family multidrug efflux MFS transporter [Hymenobacter aerilatus]